MRIFRTLYAKIFGWFWLTLTAGSLVIMIITLVSGTQLLGQRWMRLTQDLYARSAVDFYQTGGRPALERYIDTLRDGSGMQACLLDSETRNVLGGTLPPHVARVLNRSLETGVSTFRLGFIWTAATPIRDGPHFYLFVIEVRPLRGFIDGRTFATPLLGRLALAIVVAGIFCFFLTRHIVAPVRALQTAALQLAAGNLSSRVIPAIGPREDELADTARAFDLMADRIQVLIQRRQELLADISHELRSPLTRLSVSIELLRRGESDVLDKMESDIAQMNAMIGQILLLTRLDLQPSQMVFAPANLTPILRSIAADAEFETQNEDKRVSVTAPENYMVRGDATLLRSCIENVVRNAVHYTAAGTGVEITLRNFTDTAGRAQCEVLIGDHGPGVPPSALPFLFQPFYRVSESRDLREGGTGLGLSISQKIAELHQGSISAANREHQTGLVVRLLLPCA